LGNGRAPPGWCLFPSRESAQSEDHAPELIALSRRRPDADINKRVSASHLAAQLCQLPPHLLERTSMSASSGGCSGTANLYTPSL